MPALAGRISEERVGDDGERQRKLRRDQGPEHQRLQPVARRRSKGQRFAAREEEREHLEDDPQGQHPAKEVEPAYAEVAAAIGPYPVTVDRAPDGSTHKSQDVVMNAAITGLASSTPCCESLKTLPRRMPAIAQPR